MNTGLEYISLSPKGALGYLIESIWMVRNHAEASVEAIVVPDGKIDLFLFLDQEGAFEIFISGICNQPIVKAPFPKSVMFAVSFYPTAAEYVFKRSFAASLNKKLFYRMGSWDLLKKICSISRPFIRKHAIPLGLY